MEDSYEFKAGDSGEIVEELDESVGRVNVHGACVDAHISIWESKDMLFTLSYLECVP